MKIANADKLIHHFEHTVMVKNFTVPEIVTIINSFSIDIPEKSEVIAVMPKSDAKGMVYDYLAKIFDQKKPGIPEKPLSEEQISEGHKDD